MVFSGRKVRIKIIKVAEMNRKRARLRSSVITGEVGPCHSMLEPSNPPKLVMPFLILSKELSDLYTAMVLRPQRKHGAKNRHCKCVVKCYTRNGVGVSLCSGYWEPI